MDLKKSTSIKLHQHNCNPKISKCFFTLFYAGDFNGCHVDWSYDDNSTDRERSAAWACINSLFLLYHAQDAGSFYSGRWKTRTNLNLIFASVVPYILFPDRPVLKRFSRSQHRPLLITPPRLLCQCQAYLSSNGTSARLNRITSLF